MIRINILTMVNHNCFSHQLDTNKYPPSKFQFCENSTENIEWDLVVIYEGINKSWSIKCKEEGLIFISGEPPMSRVYPQNFLNQFDMVITQHPNIKHRNSKQYQPCMNWHLGLNYRNNMKSIYTFQQLANLPIMKKSKNLSMITSSQRIMPGHNIRMNFVNELKKYFLEEIDLFGKGIKPINTKAEAMLDYRFSICIENSNIPHYWTEKFADSILAYTVPIYYGCTNINDYFPKDSYIAIDINKKREAIEIIKTVLNDPEEVYKKHLPAVLEARNRIIEKYNFFSEIERIYNDTLHGNKPICKKLIKPAKEFRTFKFLHLKLRLTRLLYKLYLNYLASK